MLRDVIEAGNIPDYVLRLDEADLLWVTPRAGVVEPDQPAALSQTSLGPLAEVTLERAREIARGWDIYALQAEWRDMWHRSGRPKLRSPDKAFLGWLEKRCG